MKAMIAQWAYQTKAFQAIEVNSGNSMRPLGTPICSDPESTTGGASAAQRCAPSPADGREPSRPVQGVGWRNTRFPTRVYGYGSAVLPFFIVQRIRRLVIGDPRVHDRLLWHQGPRLTPRVSRPLGRSTDRAVW